MAFPSAQTAKNGQTLPSSSVARNARKSEAVMLVKTLKIVWVLCSLAVLGITLRSYAPGRSSDIAVFLLYCMLFLTFPAGLLVSGLFAVAAAVEERIDVPLLDLVGSNYVGFCVIWL